MLHQRKSSQQRPGFARRVDEKPVVEPVGKKAQDFGDEAHLPGDHGVARASFDGAGEAARGFARGQQEGHRVGVARGERRGDVAGRDGDDLDAAGTHFETQAFEVGNRSGFRGAVGFRAGQAANAGNLGDAGQTAPAALLHGGDEGGKGGGQTIDVDFEKTPDRGEVFLTFGQRADRDARIGYDDVRRAAATGHEIAAGGL